MSPVTQEGRHIASTSTAEIPLHVMRYQIAAGVLAVGLLALPWMFYPDGLTHGTWQQFFGRFHPLAVHLPIGLLLLMPMLEIAGRFRPALAEAAELVLVCAAACSAGAVILGMLLAHGGGFTQEAVRGHMWAGLALTVLIVWCALVRPGWVASGGGWTYPISLVGALLLMAWTGHQGGALTYGRGYLTEFAPEFVKHLGPQKVYAAVDPASVYATRIQPILDSNCVSCHSAAKIKGGLQLDSYAHLMDGGSSGNVIESAKPGKSLLLARVTLPADHQKFMPQEGKPLASKDIALIKTWIEQGASPTATAIAGIEGQALRKTALIPPVDDYSGLVKQIADTEKTMGIRLEQFSGKPSDGLVLRTINVSRTFSDAELAKLEIFAPYIVDAELGHTRVTDASIPVIGKMRHLRALHLEDTTTTGQDLKPLASLPELHYLNLSGTRVTKQALEQLSASKAIQHIYAYDTPAQPAVSPTP